MRADRRDACMHRIFLVPVAPRSATPDNVLRFFQHWWTRISGPIPTSLRPDTLSCPATVPIFWKREAASGRRTGPPASGRSTSFPAADAATDKTGLRHLPPALNESYG